MDASEAKKRVREKYPDARCEECSSYTVGTVGAWYVWAKLYATDMKCLYDNKPIKRTSHPGVPQKYCNRSCRDKFYYRHGGAEKKKAYRANKLLSLTNQGAG